MRGALVGMAAVTALVAAEVRAEPPPSTPPPAAERHEAGAVGYDSKGRRDPFVPLVRDGRLISSISGEPVAVSTSRPRLLGILWDPGGHSIALINNTEVMVGETVGLYRVAEIRRDAVVLQDGKTTLVLEMTFDDAEASEVADEAPSRARGSGGGEGP